MKEVIKAGKDEIVDNLDKLKKEIANIRKLFWISLFGVVIDLPVVNRTLSSVVEFVWSLF